MTTVSLVPCCGKLFGFEVSPSDSTGVANIPVTVDLGRVGTRGDIDISVIRAIDR